MWFLGTWFSGGFSSARFTVGLDDLFQGSFPTFMILWLRDPKLHYKVRTVEISLASRVLSLLVLLGREALDAERE